MWETSAPAANRRARGVGHGFEVRRDRVAVLVPQGAEQQVAREPGVGGGGHRRAQNGRRESLPCGTRRAAVCPLVDGRGTHPAGPHCPEGPYRERLSFEVDAGSSGGAPMAPYLSVHSPCSDNRLCSRGSQSVERNEAQSEGVP